MVVTVFAVSKPIEIIEPNATEYAEVFFEAECQLATEMPSDVSIEAEREQESTEAMPFIVEGTMLSVESETIQYIDDNLVTDLELPQLPKSKTVAGQLVEDISDDGEEVEGNDSSTYCDLTYEEKDMLLRIAMAEVGGED